MKFNGKQNVILDYYLYSADFDNSFENETKFLYVIYNSLIEGGDDFRISVEVDEFNCDKLPDNGWCLFGNYDQKLPKHYKEIVDFTKKTLVELKFKG